MPVSTRARKRKETPTAPASPPTPPTNSTSPEVQSSEDSTTSCTPTPFSDWAATPGHRALIARVLALGTHRPVYGQTAQAWDELATAVQQITDGKVSKSGKSCQERFKKLVAAHRREESRSLQKTGTNEEVTEHIKNLTDIVTYLDDRKLEDTQCTESGKKKQDEEIKAGEEMRRSAMHRMIKREDLTADLGALEGASTRERSGQRQESKKRKVLGDSSVVNTISDDDEEDSSAARKRPRTVKTDLRLILNARRNEEMAALEATRARSDAQHREQLGAINELGSSIRYMADKLLEVRAKPAAAASSDQMMEVVRLALSKN
ncbi:hypothetical protein BD410DRAFT_846289 [Rickenella mellea]|uniref:Myb-like domain-containing protein n=1 Tax=Rickenella mellea TaxID=50990 RepID=A0A4Y7PH62_9AGAM|nr:hypothetical protein BD410DRAFT_846289 [Rickenella mellea]